MKTSFSLLAALVGLTAVSATDGNNVTISSAEHDAPHEALYCWPRSDGLWFWYYNSRAEGPYDCTAKHDNSQWSMLNAYRAGGTEGLHWKYTDNVNDGECLNNWKYYSSDGQTLIATISGRTTTQSDPRRWCALPVYRSGGVQGKQWDRCLCRPENNRPDAAGGQ